LAVGWGAIYGLQAKLGASVDRLFFAAVFEYLPVGNPLIALIVDQPSETPDEETPIENLEESTDQAQQKVTPEDSSTLLLTAHLEGGWVFPYQNYYLYTSLLLGTYIDSVTLEQSEQMISRGISAANQTAVGFSWGVSGGIEAMIEKWLSIGMGLRVGLLHGKRVNPNDPRKRLNANNFYSVLWSGLTVHI